MTEHMTQDEIDRLTNSFLNGDELDTNSILEESDNVLALPINKTMLAMVKRLEWTRRNESFENIREARKALHEAAFNNWLIKKRMTRYDYYSLMNRELKKRGYPPYFRL